MTRKKHFNADAYLEALSEGELILAFCRELSITSYADLCSSTGLFPEEKQELWMKRLCSSGFIRYLHANGIR